MGLLSASWLPSVATGGVAPRNSGSKRPPKGWNRMQNNMDILWQCQSFRNKTSTGRPIVSQSSKRKALIALSYWDGWFGKLATKTLKMTFCPPKLGMSFEQNFLRITSFKTVRCYFDQKNHLFSSGFDLLRPFGVPTAGWIYWTNLECFWQSWRKRTDWHWANCAPQAMQLWLPTLYRENDFCFDSVQSTTCGTT